MTKKEAIDYIIPAIKNYWNDKICDDIIKTLAQDPSKDAISRKWIKEAAPSVTPQPKTESEGKNEN